jgi:hypothetical protein
MQIAVQLEDVQLLVVFKFLRSVQGNFDHAPKHLGAAVAYRQFQVVHHFDVRLLRVGERGSAAASLKAKGCQAAC